MHYMRLCMRGFVHRCTGKRAYEDRAETEGIQDTEAHRPAPEADRQAMIRPGASEGSSE